MKLKKTRKEHAILYYTECMADGCRSPASLKVLVSWEIPGYRDVDYQCDNVNVFINLCDGCHKSITERE